MKKRTTVLRKRGPKKAGAKKNALPAKDDLFRLFTESVDELITIIDPRGRLIYVSPSFATLVGDAPAGVDALQYVHPEDRDKIRGIWEDTFHTGRPYASEYRLRLGNDCIRHISSKIRLVHDAKGIPTSILVISKDLTERRESEQSQRLLSHAMSCTLDCFCLTDLDNNFLFVNPAFCATYGYDEDELVGRNISMIRSTDTPKNILDEIIPSTLRGGWNGELINRRKDGSPVRVELWTSVVRDETDKPIALVGVARDISVRKHAEEEIRLLHTMTQAMNDASDVQSALAIAIRKICEFTRWEMGQAWTLNSDGSLLRCSTGYFKPHPALHKFHEQSLALALAPGDGLPGSVWLTKDTVCIADLPGDRNFPRKEAAREAGFASGIALPIMTHAKVFAVAEFYGREPFELNRELSELVTTLGMQLGSVIQRKQAEEALQTTISVLTSTLESTADGVLVVDSTSRVVTFNRKFAEMWHIPESLLEMPDDSKVIDVILSQLVDPDAYVRRVENLRANPESESFDVLEFNDGRIVERSSIPQRINGKSVGRVWSFHDITERKRTEQQLIEGELKYRLLFESNPEAMWVYDAESSQFLAVNEAAVVRYGYSEKEFLAMTVGDIVAHQGVRSAGVRDAGQQPPGTILHRTKEGALLGVEFVEHPIELSGRHARLVIAKDVTAKRRTEKVQEAVYRIAQAGDRSQTLDELYKELHEIIETVMPAKNFYIALYDEHEQELSFPYFVDEVESPPPPQKLGRGLTEYVLRTGASLLVDFKMDAELQRRGEVDLVGVSSPIWLGVPLIVEHTPIGVMTVQHYSDPTVYGEAEKQILEFVSSQIAKAIDKKRGEEALKRSEAKYRTLFEESKDGIILSTRDGKVIDVNAACLDLFGYSSKEEMMKADSKHGFFYNAEDRETFLGKLALRGFVVDFEVDIRMKTGERRAVVQTASAIKDKHDEIIAYRGFVRDITERKKLEEQLRHAQKMESIGTLAGGIAHDFNNLLGIILGYASLMESDKVDPVRAAQHIQTIKKAVERGAGLVRQLLTFARKSESWLESVNVNETIKELMKMITQTFPRTIAIVSDLDNLIPSIVADTGQIHQAILNLCVNARDAIIDRYHDEGASGKVTIRTYVLSQSSIRLKFPEATASEYVVISVSDTGVGMSEETKNRIFEPFFTTKELGKGTGLGLSVVYGVLNNHHGFIGVDSTLGSGTTFSLYLPVQKRLSEIPPTVEAIPEQVLLGKETVLVVEDEEMLLNLVASLLEDKGYSVIKAKDGQEGIDVFRERHEEIACILTDMGLPRLGGWEMFLKMKEVKPKVKAILASGYCDPRIKAEMIKEGAKDFIQKPYISDLVLRRIREVIDEGNA